VRGAFADLRCLGPIRCTGRGISPPLARAAALATFLLLLIHGWLTPPAFAASRIKDIADFESVRENMLVGYGLVVGLKGTGDTLRNSAFTEESLKSMLERLGVSTRGNLLNTKNVAAVMATATLPAFARRGSRIDVSVSALGDAKSLMGGTLLVTPLLGADGEAYAVAQGPLSIGGFEAEGSAEKIVRGVPTSGRIAAGALVEREVEFALNELSEVRLALRNPDFTTADRIARVINGWLHSDNARLLDPGTVLLEVPVSYRSRTSELLTAVEQLRVEPDNRARVLIDENTGTIVIGANVHIDEVAVAQGNLTVRITETPQVSQPAPLGNGRTAEVPRTSIQVNDQSQRRVVTLDTGVTLRDLVEASTPVVSARAT
jgi:flagellar P-ring protein precursor FlgI